jgi:hypothetical protein
MKPPTTTPAMTPYFRMVRNMGVPLYGGAAIDRDPPPPGNRPNG